MTREARCVGDRRFDAPSPGARDVCMTCPLVIQCATTALQRGETWGVWGGLDLDPRRPHRATADKRHKGDQPHGTPTAWRRHERAREALCDPCRAARNAYSKQRWQARRSALQDA